MLRLSIVLLFLVAFFTGVNYSQQENETVVHVQSWKFKSLPTGDEAVAFREMLKRQSEVLNQDPRTVRSYVLRHFWGADSRDLVMISEFKNVQDMFSLYEDMDALMEKAFSADQMKKDQEMWDKYVGHHADEIYGLVEGTKK